MEPCPLCQHADSILFSSDSQREYRQCQQCQLVYVPSAQLLSPAQEQQHYQLHNNDLDDPGYRQFLQRLASPLLAALPPGQLQGLDFGCGPGPLLAKMLAEAGHQMQLWDPFFANNPAALAQSYDFICCSEAIEHFVHPAQEWQCWLHLLKPDGVLAIMTSYYHNAAHFANWHYKRDPTHIRFFHQHTFAFLARRDQLSLSFPAKDVVILRKAG
jgi:SAM-dependent methyltransferase